MEFKLKRGDLTPKQKVWMVVMMFCLITPIAIFIFWYSDSFSPRQVAAIGIINMIVVIYAGVQITKKRIAKIK